MCRTFWTQTCNPLKDLAPDATPEEIAKVAKLKKKREEDKFTCRGHILNTLSNQLLHDLKVIIPESLQVGATISKLPSPWNDYRKKLLHMEKDFTVEKILRHLRIEEETRKRDAVYFPQSSKVNHVSESKNSRKGKRMATSETEDTQEKKRKSRNCYHCNKKGHCIKDCKLLKREKDATTSKANMVEDMDLVAMVTGGIEILEIVVCAPEFRLVGARMRAPNCNAAWECPPSRGRATDAREKESPLAILRPEGRGPTSYQV
ncbi:hypothetical protein CRG98_026730 [Punica granatum]|uniref:CCHC-type domain-containing protein n=1 Tax=Punica granatum TaxID=22663 RepID=A0A2I0J9J4_PUNGR|nr:hypothetical protein CRG98_026730 [Punica granatum]